MVSEISTVCNQVTVQSFILNPYRNHENVGLMMWAKAKDT